MADNQGVSEKPLFKKGQIFNIEGNTLEFVKDVYLYDELKADQVLVNGIAPRPQDPVPKWVWDFAARAGKVGESLQTWVMDFPPGHFFADHQKCLKCGAWEGDNVPGGPCPYD